MKDVSAKVTGPFGSAFSSLLKAFSDDEYQQIVVFDPSWVEVGQANIIPQFSYGNLVAVTQVETTSGFQISKMQVKVGLQRNLSDDLSEQLDEVLCEQVLLYSQKFEVITAWCQSDHAVVAIRKTELQRHDVWLRFMREIDELHFLEGYDGV